MCVHKKKNSIGADSEVLRLQLDKDIFKIPLLNRDSLNSLLILDRAQGRQVDDPKYTLRR